MEVCLFPVVLNQTSELLEVVSCDKCKTSSYPGWIKSPHVVTFGVLKISELDSLTIFIGGGGIPELTLVIPNMKFSEERGGILELTLVIPNLKFSEIGGGAFQS